MRHATLNATTGDIAILHALLDELAQRLEGGDLLIFDPDWKPIVWTHADRAKGQAWGTLTVASFHSCGTPMVPSEGPII